MKTFAVDIYESGNLEPQTVFAYIVDEYPGEDGEPTADVLIKMPLLVKPSAIREDIEPYIEDFGLKLGYVNYTLAPQNKFVAP